MDGIAFYRAMAAAERTKIARRFSKNWQRPKNVTRSVGCADRIRRRQSADASALAASAFAGLVGAKLSDQTRDCQSLAAWNRETKPATCNSPKRQACRQRSALIAGRCGRWPGARRGAESIAGTERWHVDVSAAAVCAPRLWYQRRLGFQFQPRDGFRWSGGQPQYILLAGVAGLLAGSFSMAAGEYVSVRAQRELLEQQLSMEKQELEMSPKEEEEELALIYQAKGIPDDQARALARRIIDNPKTAIDTLGARRTRSQSRELGSPWTAAGSSFVGIHPRRLRAGAALSFYPGNQAWIASGLRVVWRYSVSAR